MGGIETLLGFLGSLSIVAMLSVAYGAVRRRLPGAALGAPVLGVLFGLVAAIQMQMSFSPIPGVVIDMRCVPVALAGAFLGLRATLVCCAIAIAARLQIGGLGTVAGSAGLVLSALAGLLWAAATRDGPRGWRALLALAAMSCANIGSVVFLPADVALWILVEAFPALAALYFLAIPAVAALLERERLLMAEEARMREAALLGAADASAPGEGLRRSFAQARSSGALAGEVVTIGLRLRWAGAVGVLWGGEALPIALRTLGARMAALLPEGGVVGPGGPALVVAAIPAPSDAALEALLTRIRREVGDVPVAVPGMAAVRPWLDIDVRRHDRLPRLGEIVAPLGQGARPAPSTPPAPRRAGPRETVAADGDNPLFVTFDRLRELRLGEA